MKTLLFIISFAMMSLFANSQDSKCGYVVTANDTIFSNRIFIGTFYTKCYLSNGEKIRIKNDDVEMYYINDRLVKRLQVYLNNKNTGKRRMMELVGVKNGICIYKFENYNGSRDCVDAIFTYYLKNECVGVQVNPSLYQLSGFINQIGNQDENRLYQLAKH